MDYITSGVNIEAGEEAVRRIKPLAASTSTPRVLSSLGGFGGLFQADFPGYKNPVLVSTTDGVGSKSEVARLLGKYDTIGIDCVAMVVDDLAAMGATPLFFLDYISMNKVDSDIVEEIVKGLTKGCQYAGCSLIGGEISEHSHMPPGSFDLVGFGVGVVERDEILPKPVQAGMSVIGLESPNLRCNGFSLARKALQQVNHYDVNKTMLDRSIIYAPVIQKIREATSVYAIAHITGGGIAGNLKRVIGDKGATIEIWRWPKYSIYKDIAIFGNIREEEMYRVFNMGIGMVLVVDSGEAGLVLDTARNMGYHPYFIGWITDNEGVEIVWR